MCSSFWNQVPLALLKPECTIRRGDVLNPGPGFPVGCRLLAVGIHFLPLKERKLLCRKCCPKYSFL